MEVGTFSTMNAAVSKFANSCTEATSNANTVLHNKQTVNEHYRGGNHGRYRDRGGYYNNHGYRRQLEYGDFVRGRGNNYNRIVEVITDVTTITEM